MMQDTISDKHTSQQMGARDLVADWLYDVNATMKMPGN